MTEELKQNYTIKETKEALVCAFKIGHAIKASMADGKFDFNDSSNLFPVIPHLQPAFENIDLVPKEFADIDASEAEELQSMIAEEVGELIEKEKLVEQINAGLIFIHAGFKFYKTLV